MSENLSERQKNPYSNFFFFLFFYKSFSRNVRKGPFENGFHNIFIKHTYDKPRHYAFYTQPVYFKFCPKICPKMSETSKFCPKIKIILSENVRNHKNTHQPKSLTNRAVVCFHKGNHLKKPSYVHNYKIRSSNEKSWKQIKSINWRTSKIKNE